MEREMNEVLSKSLIKWKICKNCGERIIDEGACPACGCADCYDDIEAYTREYYTVENGILKGYKKTAEKMWVFAPVVDIGERAFENCPLKEIYIGDGVERIGTQAFQGCKNFEKSSVPTSLNYVGAGVFNYCEHPLEISYRGGFLEWCGADMIWLHEGHRIRVEGFFLDEMEELVIPDGVTEIKQGAFQTCANLRRLILPVSVKKIGAWAWGGARNIKEIRYEGDLADWLETDSWCFAEAELFINGQSVQELEEVTVPDGVTKIGACAFYFFRNIKRVVLPSGVKELGWSAFRECKRLTEVVLPEGVEKINELAFFGCTGLEKLILPVSVDTVESDAFEGCDRKRLKIYARVKKRPPGWSEWKYSAIDSVSGKKYWRKFYWNPEKCKVKWGYKGE